MLSVADIAERYSRTHDEATERAVEAEQGGDENELDNDAAANAANVKECIRAGGGGKTRFAGGVWAAFWSDTLLLD
ncbi:MAG: hypothetical protein JNM65_15830 [Verrucomicrobiaceae bacterium]|nr:hypothetical protein [Verrucomicrobiaceae bacterium]